MARNDFMFAWLVVASFVLLLVVGGTVFFVYRSGLLSGEVPLVTETTSTYSPYFETTPEEAIEEGEEKKKNLRVSQVTVFCVDPAEELLVSEQRTVPAAGFDSGFVLNVLKSLHQPPETPNLETSVGPEIQFRAVFVEPAANTVYVDLVKLPDSWKQADPVEVSLSLYAITHTICGLNPQFRYVRFLVDGKDSEEIPGGILLSEPFSPSQDWLASGER